MKSGVKFIASKEELDNLTLNNLFQSIEQNKSFISFIIQQSYNNAHIENCLLENKLQNYQKSVYITLMMNVRMNIKTPLNRQARTRILMSHVMLMMNNNYNQDRKNPTNKRNKYLYFIYY